MHVLGCHLFSGAWYNNFIRTFFLFYDLQNDLPHDMVTFNVFALPPSAYFRRLGVNPNNVKKYLRLITNPFSIQRAFNNSDSFNSYGCGGAGGGVAMGHTL